MNGWWCKKRDVITSRFHSIYKKILKYLRNIYKRTEKNWSKFNKISGFKIKHLRVLVFRIFKIFVCEVNVQKRYGQWDWDLMGFVSRDRNLGTWDWFSWDARDWDKYCWDSPGTKISETSKSQALGPTLVQNGWVHHYFH